MQPAMTAANVLFLLAQLNVDDVLVPNALHNLTIYRHDQYVGYLDFHLGTLELVNNHTPVEEEV